MDQHLFYWILGISGSIILGVMGFFLRQVYLTIQATRCTMEKLNTTIKVLIQRMKGYDESIDEINSRLNDYHRRTERHEVEIAKIKERIAK